MWGKKESTSFESKEKPLPAKKKKVNKPKIPRKEPRSQKGVVKPVRGASWKQENEDNFDLWRQEYGYYSEDENKSKGKNIITLKAENKFLDDVFAEWGDEWFSMKEYAKWMRVERKDALKIRNKKARRQRNMDLNDMDKIRRTEVKRLRSEFRASNPASVRSLVCTDNDKFMAKVVYTRNGCEVEENLEMTEQWIAQSYMTKMVEFLKQRRDMVADTSYMVIPEAKQFRLKTTIQKVKYIPEAIKVVVDLDKQKKEINKEQKKK